MGSIPEEEIMTMVDEHEPKIAIGYELLGIRLEEHMKNYQPSHWREPVQSVTSVPYVQEEDARQLRKLHQEGRLREILERIPEELPLQGYGFQRKLPFYIKDAIVEFFEKGLAENIKYE